MRRLVICVLAIWSSEILAQEPTKPCETREHRAFDFWVGEWVVTDPEGKKVGESRIEAIQGGCVIKESWQSATSAYTGTSYNFYNQEVNRWEQLWLDNQGGFLDLKGNLGGNVMTLRSKGKKDENGVSSFNQISWTANEDGSVRQLWEVMSSDKDTQIAFDGLYRPSTEQKAME